MSTGLPRIFSIGEDREVAAVERRQRQQVQQPDEHGDERQEDRMRRPSPGRARRRRPAWPMPTTLSGPASVARASVNSNVKTRPIPCGPKSRAICCTDSFDRHARPPSRRRRSPRPARDFARAEHDADRGRSSAPRPCRSTRRDVRVNGLAVALDREHDRLPDVLRRCTSSIATGSGFAGRRRRRSGRPARSPAAAAGAATPSSVASTAARPPASVSADRRRTPARSRR